MNLLERIAGLRKKERAIRNEIDCLANGLKHNVWGFCLYIHYNEPRIGAWKLGGDVETRAVFIVKGKSVEIFSAGMYWNNWQEAEIIIKEWLSQDFSEGV